MIDPPMRLARARASRMWARNMAANIFSREQAIDACIRAFYAILFYFSRITITKKLKEDLPDPYGTWSYVD